MTDSEYVTVAQAREMLGYTKDKMTRRIKTGAIAVIPNEHDKRERLILRSDVEKLLTEGKPHKKVYKKRTPPPT
jgi:hypothetical protein